MVKTNGYTSFGLRVREKRKKLGLTVDALAKAGEMSRSYITLIENGKRLPGKKMLPKLVAAIGVKSTTLLHWYLEDIRQKMHKHLEVS